MKLPSFFWYFAFMKWVYEYIIISLFNLFLSGVKETGTV